MEATTLGLRRDAATRGYQKVVARETHLPKDGTRFVVEAAEGESSLACRRAVNADGSPSDAVSATYSWTAGTELARVDVALA